MHILDSNKKIASLTPSFTSSGTFSADSSRRSHFSAICHLFFQIIVPDPFSAFRWSDPPMFHTIVYYEHFFLSIIGVLLPFVFLIIKDGIVRRLFKWLLYWFNQRQIDLIIQQVFLSPKNCYAI